MGRAPCCDKTKVKRGPWSPEEDNTLKNYVQKYGTGGNWIALPHKAGLKRCGKSCRLRWLNYLRPDIKHGGFTEEEDNVILTLYSNIGSRWSVIASQLQGRTDNDVKNYWNTKLKKKLLALAAAASTNKYSTNFPNNSVDLGPINYTKYYGNSSSIPSISTTFPTYNNVDMMMINGYNSSSSSSTAATDNNQLIVSEMFYNNQENLLPLPRLMENEENGTNFNNNNNNYWSVGDQEMGYDLMELSSNNNSYAQEEEIINAAAAAEEIDMISNSNSVNYAFSSSLLASISEIEPYDHQGQLPQSSNFN